MCFTESTQYLIEKIFHDHRWFFQIQLILMASSTDKFFAEQLLWTTFWKTNRKVCKRSWKKFRRWYFTGNYQWALLLEKMLWYDKSMAPFKTCITQEIEEGGLTKKVIKSDVGEGFATKTWHVNHSKKRDFASDLLFEWPLWWCFTLLYFLWV